MITLDGPTRELLASGNVVLVATRNAALQPFVTRAWGVLVDEDGRRVSVGVPRATSGRTLADLAENGRVAVSFGDQISFRAVQIKGRCIAVDHEADASALERAAVQFEMFAEKAKKLGAAPHLAQALFTTDLVTITFEADEVFDQTPGRGAGEKIG